MAVPIGSWPRRPQWFLKAQVSPWLAGQGVASGYWVMGAENDWREVSAARAPVKCAGSLVDTQNVFQRMTSGTVNWSLGCVRLQARDGWQDGCVGRAGVRVRFGSLMISPSV